MSDNVDAISDYLIPTLTASEASLQILERFSNRLDCLSQMGNRVVAPAALGFGLGLAGVALHIARSVDHRRLHALTSILLAEKLSEGARHE